jgi:hypothetical protein
MPRAVAGSVSGLFRMRVATRRIFVGALLLAAAFAVAEIYLRETGAIDFPLYAVSQSLGYIPKPSQSGAFMNRNGWIFNDKSMGAGPWNPDGRPNILLIGNSVIMGGNPYDQQQKIGPLLEASLGNRYAVWPIAAGGWTDVNEAQYLIRHPEVSSRADFFVWEYMHGGLGGLNPWQGEYVFPTKRPYWASWYVFRRYILPKFIALPTRELPPDDAARPDDIAFFEDRIASLAAAGHSPAGLIFLYPDKAQLLAARSGRTWLPDKEFLRAICIAHGVILVDIADDPEWSGSLYRDGTHPSVQGNVVLARILARHLRSAVGASDGQ